jgi:hypothetical protein
MNPNTKVLIGALAVFLAGLTGIASQSAGVACIVFVAVWLIADARTQ